MIKWLTATIVGLLLAVSTPALAGHNPLDYHDGEVLTVMFICRTENAALALANADSQTEYNSIAAFRIQMAQGLCSPSSYPVVVRLKKRVFEYVDWAKRESHVWQVTAPNNTGEGWVILFPKAKQPKSPAGKNNTI